MTVTVTVSGSGTVPSSSSVIDVVVSPAVLVDVELLQDCHVSGAVLEVRRHDLGLELYGGVANVNHVEDDADVTAVFLAVKIFVGWHGANHNGKARAWGGS